MLKLVLAAEIIQFLDSIARVCCASGNVFSLGGNVADVEKTEQRESDVVWGQRVLLLQMPFKFLYLSELFM